MAASHTPEHIPLDEATYVVVDLETTGLDHRAERIIEIGAVKMVGGTPVETFDKLVNPNRLVPPKITKLTGITNEMVYRGEQLEAALTSFAAFAGDAVLVAHNAPFDSSFLNSAARGIGRGSFRNRWLDTRLIAQKLHPLLGFYRLENLVQHFGADHRPNHRALTDALATAEVFARLIDSMKREGLDTVGKASEFFYPRVRHDFEHKKSLAAGLPASSGVYLMKNGGGDVIYVGKAKDLNKRVRSYFYTGPKTERQLSLLSEIAAIDHIKTGTEIGALLLESKLIKKLKPPYNIMGKRYRRYPFVHIDYTDEVPTPKVVRKVTGRGYHYGPFSNAAELELLLEVTKDLYGLKQCNHKIRPGTKKQPCFYYQVNRCSGPCSDVITREEYERRLAAVMDAFDGRPENLRRELIRRRSNAAGKLFFEKAALFNRALQSLERTVKILEGMRDAKVNLDFLLLEDFDAATRIYLVKDGHLTSCLTTKGTERDIARLERKITRTYFNEERKPREVTPEQVENLSLLVGYFHKKPVARVRIAESPEATLSSLLDMLGVRQPSPSGEKTAGSASRPPRQTQLALRLR